MSKYTLFTVILALISFQVSALNGHLHSPRIVEFPFYSHKVVPQVYRETIISNVLSKDELTEVLQRFFNDVYKVGFLEFGVEYDADHFHFLGVRSSDGKLRIHGLLYHTQEHIRDLPEEEKNKYVVIKYQNRSWIQWLDTLDSELALNYVYDEIPERLRDSWDFYMPRYTVKGELIDPIKFGVPEVFDFGQITFHKAECNSFQEVLVEIKDSNGFPLCLILENKTAENMSI